MRSVFRTPGKAVCVGAVVVLACLEPLMCTNLIKSYFDMKRVDVVVVVQKNLICTIVP